jgi:hypothetical protein
VPHAVPRVVGEMGGNLHPADATLVGLVSAGREHNRRVSQRVTLSTTHIGVKLDVSDQVNRAALAH